MWDVERILENPRQRGTQPVSDLDGLRGQLDDIEEYRIRFADHVHRLLYNDGPLTPENAAALWMNRAEQLDLAIVAESARWGDSPGANSRQDERDLDRRRSDDDMRYREDRRARPNSFSRERCE